MTSFHPDAPAWVKRYYGERGSEQIHELLCGEDLRVCSVPGAVEVAATLARKHKAQEITREDFEAKIAETELDWRSFVQIELTPGALDQAPDGAPGVAFRGADALHFAALQSLERRSSNSGYRVVLIASDRELKEAEAASGARVRASVLRGGWSLWPLPPPGARRSRSVWSGGLPGSAPPPCVVLLECVRS